MKKFSISPKEMVTSFWRNRSLIITLIKRDIIGRYQGSFLGIFWAFFNPLLMLLVYTFVFSVVFKARWGGTSDSKAEFALALFSGLLVFGIFAECINRAPSIILNNINYVKKIIFPLEILPWVLMGTALFHAAISLLVWFVAYCIFLGIPSINILLLPLILLPLILFIIGACWFISSLGVYLRDIGQFIGAIVTMLMFLSPIFYPVTMLPEEMQKFIMMNPLTPVIESSRNLLFKGEKPDFIILCLYTCVSSLISWFGFIWFQKTRKGFADVI